MGTPKGGLAPACEPREAQEGRGKEVLDGRQWGRRNTVLSRQKRPLTCLHWMSGSTGGISVFLGPSGNRVVTRGSERPPLCSRLGVGHEHQPQGQLSPSAAALRACEGL